MSHQQITYLLSTILVVETKGEVLARCEGLETVDVDLVGGTDLVIVGGVDERQCKHTLLLEVGLVDTGEGASDDSKTTEEARLEGGVLARRTLTVVVVADDDPLDAPVAIPSSGLGYTIIFAGNLVLDLVGLAVLRVDGANQAVLCTHMSVRCSIASIAELYSREMFSRCPRNLSQGPPAEM